MERPLGLFHFLSHPPHGRQKKIIVGVGTTSDNIEVGVGGGLVQPEKNVEGGLISLSFAWEKIMLWGVNDIIFEVHKIGVK